MAERNTDSLIAALTPGEFVWTKAAVERAGGPEVLYGVMNALDPKSEKPEEAGYQYGGSVLGSLLSRTQEKDEGPVYPKPDFTIPAGKNILGQTTEEMGAEEFMEMFMPSGGAPVVGMAKQIGKEGLKNLIQGRKPKIIKALEKMQETGSSPKVGKKVAEDIQWQEYLYDLYRKSTTRGSTSPIIKKQKKQRGGSIDDFSLMDYMMPAMEKRLGPPLKKFQSGGSVPQPGDPGYYAYMQQQGQSGAPPGYTPPAPGTGSGYGGGTSWTVATAPTGGAQSQLIQPSDIYSTGIGSIFGEMGLQTPGSEYLENIQAYDPTQQRRMQQDLGRKMPGIGGTGASGFAGQTGAEIRESGKQREAVTQQYTRGAEDLRKQYREQIMQDVLADMSAGTYEFEDLG
jgi:hypothetical protein